MQICVPLPPLLLVLQKDFLGTHMGYFYFIQADVLTGISFCGSNEVFISTLN